MSGAAKAMTPEEVERYARHLVLRGVGGPGQQRLRAARVTVIGAGGLGAPVLAYLAAAGVGSLRIVDNDTVALSNLQRQILFQTSDIARPKVEAAEAAVAGLNPHVSVEPLDIYIDSENVHEAIAGADVVADGTDNAAARYLVADACETAAIPLVSAAVSGFSGQVTTFAPHTRSADGTPRAGYRTLFPEQPPDGLDDLCSQTGILGVVTGVIGTLQANEVLKLILELGEPLYGRLLLFDALNARFETIEYGPS